MYQWPISSRREGSVGTIIYFRVPRLSFFFEKKKEKEREKVWGEMIRRYWNINFEEMMKALMEKDFEVEKIHQFVKDNFANYDGQATHKALQYIFGNQDM